MLTLLPAENGCCNNLKLVLIHRDDVQGRSHEGRGRKEYMIRGERLRDRAPVLECVVQKGLVYNKVNPIFHHWRVDERKFGLTFQSPADAVSFEKGLQGLIDKMDRGSDSTSSSSTPEEGDTEDDGQASHTGSESSSTSRKEMLPKPVTIVTSQSSSTCFVRPEEFGFAAEHRGDLRSLDPCKDLWGSRGYEDYRRAASTRTLVGGLTGGVVVGSGGAGPQDKAELCVVRFQKEPGSGGGPDAVEAKGPRRLSSGSPVCPSSGVSSAAGSPREAGGKGSPSSCCVHASPATPRSRTRKRGGGGGGNGGSGGSGGSDTGAVSPDEEGGGPCPRGSSSSCAARCVYCRSVFSAADNGRGRCRDAPDPAVRCLRRWTCVWCAESLLYHCASDSEGEFWEPCSCEDPPGGRPHPLCCARWLALLALALCVPCMCCYPPLSACLRCGERCGCCGGKHKAVR
ncbi:hypothetical protein NHX12_007944 [Muraenolepis orangiensis]|uniref:WH1 domain-containing protein n=1 Tax=Muraenolepis orangiensis TaxID=630683 RepID=A0A9Q0DKJ4_9TELE|nr:hypothetical protein NHX12_007944 [Muraenolepis orangiensis]